MPILVKIDGLKDRGDATLVGYDDGAWFTADSLSFGIDRELERRGSKGGTVDINIGVGELDQIMITKELDGVSPLLAQLAVTGNSGGDARIDVVTTAGERPEVFLRYQLRRCYVAGWSTSGSADERLREYVSLAFNKVAFATTDADDVFGWDLVKQKRWTKHGLDRLPTKR